jgi:hypothetical protein
MLELLSCRFYHVLGQFIDFNSVLFDCKLVLYLDGFGQLSVGVTTALSNHVSEVRGHVERVDEGHPVEVEVL